MQRTSEESEKPGTLLGSFVCFEQLSLRGSVAGERRHNQWRRSTLLHDQVIDWNATDPLASVMKTTEALQHDDGFRAPDEDPEAAYVAWDGEETHHQTIYFLHGALHIYDYGHELQKKCWERSGGIFSGSDTSLTK